jgi:hypothetical protein
MIRQPISVEVPFATVFPYGALCLSVDAVDEDAGPRGQTTAAASQAPAGERSWVVRVTDLDPEAARPGRTTEVKVRIVAPAQPAPPKREDPRVPPQVVFEGLTVTPHVDSSRCNGSSNRCRGRLAYAYEAVAMRAPNAGELAQISCAVEGGHRS